MSVQRESRHMIMPAAFEAALPGTCPTCGCMVYRLVVEASDDPSRGVLHAESISRKFKCGFEVWAHFHEIGSTPCLALTDQPAVEERT